MRKKTLLNTKPALIKKAIRNCNKEYKTWQSYLKNYRIISEKMDYYENEVFFWSPTRQKFICGKDLKENL